MENKKLKVLGSGQYRYERVERWPNVPKYFEMGQPSDVAINSSGEIFVLSRGNHPVTVWTPEGDFIGSWGEGMFSLMPHGISIGKDDNVWIVDCNAHVAMEFSPHGQVLRTLGNKNSPSPTCEGRLVHSQPFNMPTNLAIAPNGDIFVADGYGGHKVHRFNSKGELLLSWGRQGRGPGQFELVHNVWIDSRDRVLICDDENDRVQLFDMEGTYLEEWEIGNPSGICIKDDIVHFAQLQPFENKMNGRGSGSISLYDLDGKLLTSWDSTASDDKETLIGPHDLCVAQNGDIYVCEVYGWRMSKFRKLD